MNLIDARKQAYEGWVRSPSRTENRWMQLHINLMRTEAGIGYCYVDTAALDVEDWEPKRAPAKLFDCELLVHDDGSIRVMKPGHDLTSWGLCGWRKIRVKEVEG